MKTLEQAITVVNNTLEGRSSARISLGAQYDTYSIENEGGSKQYAYGLSAKEACQFILGISQGIDLGRVSRQNLDALDPEDLLGEAKRTDAPIPYTTYASCKRRAIECRTKGMITAATSYEADCDTAYKDIPKEWKW